MMAHTHKPAMLRKPLMVLAAVGLLLLQMPPSVSALISACTAGVSPHIIPPAAETNLQFTVTNNDASNAVHWIRFSRPTGDYSISGDPDTPDWQQARSGEQLTIYEGTLSAGDSITVTFAVQTEDVEANTESWVVEMSEDFDGSNPTACTGNVGTSISGITPDTQEPEISNLRLTNLSATGVTIQWDTDEVADSTVDYGTTAGYGSSKGDGSLTTSHLVSLTELTASTAYHFRVRSKDASGNEVVGSDNTFLTAVQQNPSTVVVNIPDGTISETEPPNVRLIQTPGAVVTAVPTFKGLATDNTGVAKIEYSTDGGRNWLPADSIDNLGGTSTNFSFTPVQLEDGDYVVVVRAIDFSGNSRMTEPFTMVYDRLPPQVGGGLIAIGPQILYPDENGVIRALVGVDEKISVSAIGGATRISLYATHRDTKAEHLFNLAQVPESGLWSGVISFQVAGTYELEARSLDGAGNNTERSLGSLLVLPAAKVLSAKDNQPVVGAEATLYYQEPDAKEWVIWDAKAYNQTNPQTIGQDGQLNLLVPPGTYYLKITAKGFKPLISEILKLSQSTPFASEIKLTPRFDVSFGLIDFRLPSWRTTLVSLGGEAVSTENSLVGGIVGQPLPNFTLSMTNGKTVSTFDLNGRPSVISMLNTWAPTATEQVSALAELQTNKDINIIPLFAHEAAGKIAVYLTTAGVTVYAVGDPDGILVDGLNYGTVTVPTHYFADRKGVIKKVKFGVLSKEEIMHELGGL